MDHRGLVAACVGLIVTYSVVVLWYVATFPDIGLRCLLPFDGDPPATGGLEIQYVLPDVGVPSLKPGHHLLTLNGQRIRTFLDFIEQLNALRSAKIEAGGLLQPGSDPSELSVPPLVEINGTTLDAIPERQVELQFVNPLSPEPRLKNRVYVPIRPIHMFDMTLTIIWFVSQLAILSVAVTAYWQRPSDRLARNFCLMSCFAMGAFVAGFHWWILVSNPILNIPFIICATLLPATVLNFFLGFPSEPEFLKSHRLRTLLLLFVPAALITLALVLVYWTAWCLNGRSDDRLALNLFQKMTVLLNLVSGSAAAPLNFSALSTSLLSRLRGIVHVAIGTGSVYFVLTVVQLSTTMWRIQAPRERRQTLSILAAALTATVPIGYTMFLAFFRKVDFALGQAQLPMFLASMLFMVAYAHGMLRHRLILTDDPGRTSWRYTLMSILVSGGFAMCLAFGGVAAHAYHLPLNSSTMQQISLFLILLLAAVLSLWVRDRLQAVVDRRFYSEKYQLDRALQQLNRAAGYLADPSGMSEITLRTCQDVTDASSASMYARDATGVYHLIGSRSASALPPTLKPEQVPAAEPGERVVQRVPTPNRESMSPVQRLLHDLRAELLCFLLDEDGLHGFIVVGRRRGGVAYTAEDIAFLHAMGQMSLLALHSSRANQSMARLDAELKAKMDRIADQQRQLTMLRAELTSLQQDAGQAPVLADDGEFDRCGIRGSSPPLLEVLAQVRKVARSSSTALIRGESGTGKESLARVIHRNSDRASAPLICVNCAALSSSLLESELFGHVRGAFTGAHADKSGRFQAAHGGTLFLDEIGDIASDTQVKLLRVLQERCFEPVGSDRTVHVDVRLIAATNRDLEDLIAQGLFREDLFYRLNVVTLTLPPLRARPEDLIELVFFFLSRSSQKEKKQIRQIDPDALAALERHSWPGNIRELENVIERAVVLADSDTITLTDLPSELRRSPGSIQPPVAGTSARRTVIGHDVRDPAADLPTTSSPLSTDWMGSADEEKLLREVLRAAAGNKARAARRLNLPRSTFYSKCKKYGIS